jgi:hypothetical protein
MLRHHSEADIANACDERNLVARSIQLGYKGSELRFLCRRCLCRLPGFHFNIGSCHSVSDRHLCTDFEITVSFRVRVARDLPAILSLLDSDHATVHFQDRSGYLISFCAKRLITGHMSAINTVRAGKRTADKDRPALCHFQNAGEPFYSALQNVGAAGGTALLAVPVSQQCAFFRDAIDVGCAAHQSVRISRDIPHF